MKALVVSSHQASRARLRAALGVYWETDEAADGLEALRLVRDGDFDLVIADEATEPFGAFGLARELKILDLPPGVIVVLDRKQDEWLTKWSGADRWLVRPVDPFELARIAAEVVDQLDASVAEPAPNDDEPAAAGS